MDEKTVEKLGCGVVLGIIALAAFSACVIIWAFIELVLWITSK